LKLIQLSQILLKNNFPKNTLKNKILNKTHSIKCQNINKIYKNNNKIKILIKFQNFNKIIIIINFKKINKMLHILIKLNNKINFKFHNNNKSTLIKHSKYNNQLAKHINKILIYRKFKMEI